MPELPEVETVRRTLAPIIGARIGSVWTSGKGLHMARRPPQAAMRALVGARITELRRHGKYLLLDTSTPKSLLFHLGMSGRLRVQSAREPRAPHTHVIIGLGARELRYVDPRRFGQCDVIERASPNDHEGLALLGPDPLVDGIDAAALHAAARARRVTLKALVLDQAVLAGMGNIYVSEALWRARLRPGAIVDATGASPDDWIVEIGAGLGTLTARLAERVPAGKVIALERDRDMVAVLRAELAGAANVEIEEGDALRYDLGAVAMRRGRPIIACGNLPYHIAAPLLFVVLAARPHVARAVVMVQKEMADRIVAAPATEAYGALGVMIQTYADVTLVARAGAHAFHPPPNVDSAVLRLVPLAAPREDLGDATTYDQVVHAAFGQRRKTLRNALRTRLGDDVDRVLAEARIDSGRRGETLSIAEFARIARVATTSTQPGEKR